MKLPHVSVGPPTFPCVLYDSLSLFLLFLSIFYGSLLLFYVHFHWQKPECKNKIITLSLVEKCVCVNI